MGKTIPNQLSVTEDAQLVSNAAGKQPREEAERALLTFISAGDRSAMDRLYVLYFASLANFFLHLTAHADLVEELINDTMVEVWRGGVAIGAKAAVAVSIMGLAYSNGQKRVAKVGGLRLHSQPSALHTEQGSPRSTTLEESLRLDESLLKLPVEERALLHLVYVGGYSRRGISDIMKIFWERGDAPLRDTSPLRGCE